MFWTFQHINNLQPSHISNAHIFTKLFTFHENNDLKSWTLSFYIIINHARHFNFNFIRRKNFVKWTKWYITSVLFLQKKLKSKPHTFPRVVFQGNKYQYFIGSLQCCADQVVYNWVAFHKGSRYIKMTSNLSVLI